MNNRFATINQPAKPPKAKRIEKKCKQHTCKPRKTDRQWRFAVDFPYKERELALFSITFALTFIMADHVQELALQFVDLASESIKGLSRKTASSTLSRRFIAHFGVTPKHCAFVWLYVREKALDIDSFASKEHLLWTLNLLKSDDTEHELQGRWGPTEKTIRKWTSIFLSALGDLGVVSNERE